MEEGDPEDDTSSCLSPGGDRQHKQRRQQTVVVQIGRAGGQIRVRKTKFS